MLDSNEQKQKTKNLISRVPKLLIICPFSSSPFCEADSKSQNRSILCSERFSMPIPVPGVNWARKSSICSQMTMCCCRGCDIAHRERKTLHPSHAKDTEKGLPCLRTGNRSSAGQNSREQIYEMPWRAQKVDLPRSQEIPLGQRSGSVQAADPREWTSTASRER